MSYITITKPGEYHLKLVIADSEGNIHTELKPLTVDIDRSKGKRDLRCVLISVLASIPTALLTYKVLVWLGF